MPQASESDVFRKACIAYTTFLFPAKFTTFRTCLSCYDPDHRNFPKSQEPRGTIHAAVGTAQHDKDRRSILDSWGTGGVDQPISRFPRAPCEVQRQRFESRVVPQGMTDEAAMGHLAQYYWFSPGFLMPTRPYKVDMFLEHDRDLHIISSWLNISGSSISICWLSLQVRLACRILWSTIPTR